MFLFIDIWDKVNYSQSCYYNIGKITFTYKCVKRFD